MSEWTYTGQPFSEWPPAVQRHYHAIGEAPELGDTVPVSDEVAPEAPAEAATDEPEAPSTMDEGTEGDSPEAA